jgi:hypothetical protein
MSGTAHVFSPIRGKVSNSLLRQPFLDPGLVESPLLTVAATGGDATLGNLTPADHLSDPLDGAAESASDVAALDDLGRLEAISDPLQLGVDSFGGSGYSFQNRSKLVVRFGHDFTVCLLSSPLLDALSGFPGKRAVRQLVGGRGAGMGATGLGLGSGDAH